MNPTPVKIVVVYQSLLGIYGDQGNSRVLQQRARWRGIDAEVVFAEPGTPLPEDGAIYLLGGGEDAAQTTAVRELRADGGLFRALDAGAVLFAVCAGYQICGHTFTIGGAEEEVREGLGVLDVTTRRGASRAVGEVLTHWTRPDGSDYVLTGFENHRGATSLGADARPLGTVRHGTGNALGGGVEGVVQGSVLGTYMHGPLLARNPELADYLLTQATGADLAPLDLPEITRLRSERIHAAR